MPSTAYSPSAVRPRRLHCAAWREAPPYCGSSTPSGRAPRTRASAPSSVSAASPKPIGLSCSGPGHGSVLQKVPVDRNWPALTAIPWVPESNRTPHRALSNLWHRNMLRTPRRCSSSRPRSMSSMVQRALSSTCLQPNGSEVSTPRTTASLPCRMTSRAWSGSVTTRNQPLPAPPYMASTWAWSSYVFWIWSRIAVISSQPRSLKKYSEQMTPLVTMSFTRTRCPPRQARSTHA